MLKRGKGGGQSRECSGGRIVGIGEVVLGQRRGRGSFRVE